jgi:hypothetical protein
MHGTNIKLKPNRILMSLLCIGNGNDYFQWYRVLQCCFFFFNPFFFPGFWCLICSLLFDLSFVYVFSRLYFLLEKFGFFFKL